MSTDEPLSGNPSSRTGQNDARTTRPMPVAGEAGADGSIASLSNGRYQLVERIGAGSIGQVWRAQDTTLQREVAIKTINLATSADPSTEARFRREAIATAGLNHPSIVQIYDSGVDGHSAYIVMEFLHGPNLQSIVTERGPIDWRAAVPLLAQVAAGLGSAHRLGVVHRDVKPANVVLSSEELTSTPKLVDFGIARLADQQATALTSTMTAIGSAAYMSPEQAAGERVGPNSDMYSFGCLMMTVLTGQPPFPGESPVAVARAQVYDTPPLLRSRVPDAPVSLENLVAALMDKSPEARPSATETVAALNAIHGDPDAPGLIEPPRPAGPGTDMATVAMSAAALGAAATQTADGQGLTRILPADASAAEAASGPGASGDPLAALDHLAQAEAALDAALAPARAQEENNSRARASLGSRLVRLNSQITAVTSYITTHRGAVGPSARTALSEASRHAGAANSIQDTDPSAALSEVAQGEPLVAQAQTLAEADVRQSGSWGSDSGAGGGQGRGGGLDVGSLVLGGLLMGGLSGGHHGGWGGPDLDFDFFD